MIQKHVLKDIFGDTNRMKRLRHAFPHKWRLRGVFQHSRIACDQCGGNSVDRRHIGVIPRGHDQNDAVRHTFYHAAKRVAVLDLDIGQCILCDLGHITCAFVKPAEFPAIPHRAAHLMRNFRHDVVIHRANSSNTVLHKLNTLCQRSCRPVNLRRFCTGNGRVSFAPR